MAELKGTQVAAGIVPFTSDDKYATHDALYGKGGFRSVASTGERDAIPAERKTKGMIVRVTDSGLNYEWNGEAWVEWIPKGSVTVDQSLNAESTNAVSNKAVTTKLNAVEAVANKNKEDVAALQAFKASVGNRNAVNGYAGLDGSGKLLPHLLPAGYDNVDFLEDFLQTAPEAPIWIPGKVYYLAYNKKIFYAKGPNQGNEADPSADVVYINVKTNKSYRWTGTDMVVVGDGSGVALGVTEHTAFRGDQGKEMYDYLCVNATLQGGGAAVKRKDVLDQAADFFHRIDTANVPFVLCVNDPDRTLTGTGTESLEFELGTATGADADSYDQSSALRMSINKVDAAKAGVMTPGMLKTLQELELQVFPLSISLTGGGVFEKGAKSRATVGITVTRKGVDVTKDCTITVTGAEGTLNEEKTVWTPSVDITSNVDVTVKAVYGQQTVTKAIWYGFKLKKYWGVSASENLTTEEVLKLAGSGWADARQMGATKFDCTGGKYPWYVLPASMAAGVEVWVGGLRNTDIQEQRIVNFVNASGHQEAYVAVRLMNKQTGVLSIEFK